MREESRERSRNGGRGVEENPVLAEVARWPGVSVQEGSRGELSVRLDRVEIGHMHGSGVAHFGFPKGLWAELMWEGIVAPHPVDRPGWAARHIRDRGDVAGAVDLFRLNYERLLRRKGGEGRGGHGDEGRSQP